MLIEITLPLLGSFTVPFIVMPLFWSAIFLVALFLAIHFDTKEDKAAN
jgi:hypothetical protein